MDLLEKAAAGISGMTLDEIAAMNAEEDDREENSRELPDDAADCLTTLGLTEEEAETAIADYYAGY